jgi:hypothetical protein
MRIRAAAAGLALILVWTPAALASQAPLTPAATAPLSPQARAFVDQWRAELDRLAQEAPTKDPVANLARRTRIDRAAHAGLAQAAQGAAPAAERGRVLAQMFKHILDIERDNTAALKAALPAEGWFSERRHGPTAAQDALLIVQHSPDRAFQTEVLTRLEPLVARGEIQGRDYALLFDRVQISSGRPQRFASQALCERGARNLAPLDGPAAIETRRKAIGWPETLEETQRRLKVGQPC